jgi:hypothetical protein
MSSSKSELAVCSFRSDGASVVAQAACQGNLVADGAVIDRGELGPRH